MDFAHLENMRTFHLLLQILSLTVAGWMASYSEVEAKSKRSKIEACRTYDFYGWLMTDNNQQPHIRIGNGAKMPFQIDLTVAGLVSQSAWDLRGKFVQARVRIVKVNAAKNHYRGVLISIGSMQPEKPYYDPRIKFTATDEPANCRLLASFQP